MLTFLAAAVLPYLQVVATAAVPAVGAVVVAWLHTTERRGILEGAFARAAAEAYGQVVMSGRSISDPQVVTRAVEAGSRYLLDRVPDTMRAHGVDPEAATQIVRAELGKLLAADPTVRAAP